MASVLLSSPMSQVSSQVSQVSQVSASSPYDNINGKQSEIFDTQSEIFDTVEEAEAAVKNQQMMHTFSASRNYAMNETGEILLNSKRKRIKLWRNFKCFAHIDCKFQTKIKYENGKYSVRNNELPHSKKINCNSRIPRVMKKQIITLHEGGIQPAVQMRLFKFGSLTNQREKLTEEVFKVTLAQAITYMHINIRTKSF